MLATEKQDDLPPIRRESRGGMNLATDPWIPTLDRDGHTRQVSLINLFDVHGDAELVNGPHDFEQLTAAAIRRLLLAIVGAARQQSWTPLEWLRVNSARFDLSHRIEPFGQCAALAQVADISLLGASALPMFTAGAGATLLDHHTPDRLPTLDWATATRLMLVRQAFGTAQRQPYRGGAVYAKDASFGKNTPCLTRPLLTPVTGNGIVADLEAAWDGIEPTGTFHFTWPAGVTPGSAATPDGNLAVLTWPGRAIWLDGDQNQVTGCVIAAGAAWDDTDPILQPHMLAYLDPKTGERRPHRASVATSWSRTFLKHWVAADGGLPARWKADPASGVARVRIEGLIADKGRIDAVEQRIVSLPTVDDATLSAWLDGVSQLYKNTFGKVASATTSGHPLADPKSMFGDAQAVLDRIVERWGQVVAVGQASVTDALAGCAADVNRELWRTFAEPRLLHTRTPAAAWPLQEGSPR